MRALFIVRNDIVARLGADQRDSEMDLVAVPGIHDTCTVSDEFNIRYGSCPDTTCDHHHAGKP